MMKSSKLTWIKNRTRLYEALYASRNSDIPHIRKAYIEMAVEDWNIKQFWHAQNDEESF